MSDRIGSPGSNFLKDEVAEAENAGEKIIEIVGDAARQLSHGFHLLSLPQLFLASSERTQVVLALDRDLRQVGRDAEQSRIVGVRRIGLTMEDRQRAQHRSVGAKEE